MSTVVEGLPTVDGCFPGARTPSAQSLISSSLNSSILKNRGNNRGGLLRGQPTHSSREVDENTLKFGNSKPGTATNPVEIA